MSKEFNYKITGVPDLDQRWDALPNNGSMYCVPTSAMNWMYYLAKHGRAGALTHRPADTSNAGLVRANLIRMADYMDTDPEDGTNSGDGFDGLADYLDDHHIHSRLTTERAPDGDNISYQDIVNLTIAESLVIVGRGKYSKDDDEFERTSGHAMTLVGFERDGDRMEMIVHDPADDSTNLHTQSATVDTATSVKEETRNIEGDVVKVLRWGSGADPYQFIDGWVAIQPLFALTNPTAKVLLSYTADLKAASIEKKEFALPLTGDLVDLAIHPSLPRASVIARGSSDIWTLDLARGSWNKTATAAEPQFLTYGGRRHRLFVGQGREILSFDQTGRLHGKLDTGVVIDAMSYDQKNNRLLVASSSSKRLLSVGPELKVLGHVEAPDMPGDSRLMMSVNGRDATIVLTRQGSPEGATLRWHPTGAVATGRFRLLANGPTTAAHVNRNGHVFVVEAGKIATFDTDGNRVAGSVFDGLSGGPLFKVARSTKNLDEVRSRRKEWKN